jgi:hypothetical protein
MWKKMLIVMSIISLILVLILSGGLYYAYTHRQVLTEKVMAYAVENIGGQFNPLKQNGNGSASSVAISGGGLENMLGALLGGGEDDGAALGQMAQQLLAGLNGQAGSERNSAGSTSSGSDINARDSHGRTLLMNVCRVDVSAKVVKMILRYGADLEAVDEKGRTALMYAVALNQDPEVVAVLVEAGANVKARDYSGKSVRQYAADDEEIKALLQKR